MTKTTLRGRRSNDRRDVSPLSTAYMASPRFIALDEGARTLLLAMSLYADDDGYVVLDDDGVPAQYRIVEGFPVRVSIKRRTPKARGRRR